MFVAHGRKDTDVNIESTDTLETFETPMKGERVEWVHKDTRNIVTTTSDELADEVT